MDARTLVSAAYRSHNGDTVDTAVVTLRVDELSALVDQPRFLIVPGDPAVAMPLLPKRYDAVVCIDGLACARQPHDLARLRRAAKSRRVKRRARRAARYDEMIVPDRAYLPWWRRLLGR